MRSFRKSLFLFFILNFLLSLTNTFAFLADDELTFAFCEQSGVLQAFNIVGKVITIIKVLVPVFLIVTSGITLLKAVLDQDDSKINRFVELFIVKIIVGAFIFFIPTILGTVFSIANGYDTTVSKFTECGTCFTSSSSCQTKINTAKEKERIELASSIEEYNNKVEQNQKQNNNNNNNNNSNSGSTTPVTPTNSISYGKGCTGYVSNNSYNATIARNILNKAATKVGVSYSKMDCSDFVSYVFSDYVEDNTAAGLGKTTRNKCVKAEDVQPGDIFFTSNYNKGGACTHCNGSTHGNRCNRYNCIMHVGIVTEVSNGKITKIIHSSTGGVHYKAPSYLYSPNGTGSSWYIGFSRPYA